MRTQKQKIDLINEMLASTELRDENFNSITNPKVIKLRDVTWTNDFTRRAEKVSNIYTFAHLSSGYAKMINSIYVKGIYNKEPLNFRVNLVSFYNHLNISDYKSSMWIISKDKENPFEIMITFQSFCNPISPCHLYEDEGIDVLLATNLETQNSDDSFSVGISVRNSVFDKRMACFAKCDSSYIELLTNKSAGDLQYHIEKNNFQNLVKDIVDTKPDEVWAKLKSDDHYTKFSIDDYNKKKSKCSTYYPVIKYDDIAKLELGKLKAKFDMSIFGLGSAGTAILDLICRCNYFKKLYFVDYDYVERKNLRNQWYTNRQICLNKTIASSNLVAEVSDKQIQSDWENKKIEDVDLSKTESKYVVSGFDNIKARKYVFNKILSGEFKAKYLIDCRYLDLACSIYIVDTENMSEMTYYYNQLDADEKLLDQQKPLTKDEFINYFSERSGFTSNCYGLCARININRCNGIYTCSSDNCKEHIYNEYLKAFENNPNCLSEEENTCLKQNLIDIYKYVGTIVMGAIRCIEHNEPKPFTHIEAETNVNGLPAYMIVKE